MESQTVQKFKKQMRHVQKICYQGQDRFQWSSTKSIHVQPIFSLGQNNVVTFKKLGSLRIDDFRTTAPLGHLIVPRRRPVEIWIYDSQ